MSNNQHPPSNAAVDVTPEFREKVRGVYREWEASKISYEEAVNRLEKLRREATTRTNSADEGYIEAQLGIMQGYRGNYNASLQHLERSRDLYIEAQSYYRIAQATINIGETYRLKGNYARARQYFNAGYEAAVEKGDRALQVLARSNESLMLLNQGRSDLAEARLLECYTLYQELRAEQHGETTDNNAGYRGQFCEINEALAQIYLETNRFEQAWERTIEAHTVAQQMGSAVRIGFANRIVGEVITNTDLLPDGYVSDPDFYFQAALDAFREVNAEAEIARTLLVQGKSLGQRSKGGIATRKLQQAVTIFTRLNMVEEAAKAAEAQINLL